MTGSARYGGRAAAVVAAGGLATLGGALMMQYAGGLAPCELCLWQRWPYGVAIGLALLALLLIRQHGRARGPDPWAAAPLVGCTVAFAVGAGLGAFHVGVEQGWWQGLAECGGGGTPDSLQALKAQVLGAPVVRCDAVAWSLFGISLAGYNILISLALGGVSLAGARRLLRGRGDG